MTRALAVACLLTACGEQVLDAGNDVPRGLLPVDERNPVVLSNDGTGNWYGLYALLFAHHGGPRLSGISVNSSSYATNLDENLAAWRELVAAARASGMQNVPEPVRSTGPPLGRPASGEIDATNANGSEGARLIVDSARLSTARRPLVVVAGGRLTDVADAYLLDPAVAERVVVVAALGSRSGDRAVMGAPNGELDPWADWIVAERFRYVQVSSFYDATLDLPDSSLGSLPNSPLGELVARQQPNITNVLTQADQVSILAVGLPAFVTAVERVTRDPAQTFDAESGPELLPSDTGRAWIVTEIDPSVAGARLQQLLSNTPRNAP